MLKKVAELQARKKDLELKNSPKTQARGGVLNFNELEGINFSTG